MDLLPDLTQAPAHLDFLASLCQVEPGAISTQVMTHTRRGLCPWANAEVTPLEMCLTL